MAGTACSTGTVATDSTGTTLPVAPHPGLSAVAEAESWFRAMNAGDIAANLAHFDPSVRSNYVNVVGWPTFTSVKCGGAESILPPSRRQADSSTALVHCTFESHGDPSSANDTFWNIEFRRSADGVWLITNYGQG